MDISLAYGIPRFFLETQFIIQKPSWSDLLLISFLVCLFIYAINVQFSKDK